MIRGPKYKIARRLGAPVFEKTQTQKFKLSEEKRGAGKRKGGFGTATNFSLQLNEKQKARFTYGVSEKQFKNYVKKIIENKISNPQSELFIALESRLDNVVARLGLATTRAFARQLVSHGHITINGKKVTIPSYKVGKGDIVALREGSKGKPVFKEAYEQAKTREIPAWLAYDVEKKAWNIQGVPKLEGENLLFDLDLVIQYYKR